MLKNSQQQRRKRIAKMSAEEITRLNKKKRTDYADIAHIKKKTIRVRKPEENNQTRNQKRREEWANLPKEVKDLIYLPKNQKRRE